MNFRVPNPIRLMKLLNDPVKFKVACCILDWLPPEDWKTGKWKTKPITNSNITLKYNFPPLTMRKAVKTMISKGVCTVSRASFTAGTIYDFTPLVKMTPGKFIVPIDSLAITAPQEILARSGNYIKAYLLKKRAPDITDFQIAKYGGMDIRSVPKDLDNIPSDTTVEEAFVAVEPVEELDTMPYDMSIEEIEQQLAEIRAHKEEMAKQEAEEYQKYLKRRAETEAQYKKEQERIAFHNEEWRQSQRQRFLKGY